MKKRTQSSFLPGVVVLGLLLLSGCSSLAAPLKSAANGQALTGMDELDQIIEYVLEGDQIGLQALLQFVPTGCTYKDGLGGPPKCEGDEDEGTIVEVLPFLGPEGHFLRKENLSSWGGIDASDLYAVFVVSDSAYTEPIYPRGEYAIAFINQDHFLITTLQISDGRIVRVDSTLGNPPVIRMDDVDTYLVQPKDLGQ